MPNDSILIDNFGRNHNYLRISLTEKCNLRCKYCMPIDGVTLTPKNELMSADEIFYIAKIFTQNGIDKIRLTGGEPLLRKDFPKIISKLATLDVKLSITTNGILIDQYLDILKKFSVMDINLSLDTLNTFKFSFITLRDQFEKVLENLYLLLNNNFNIKINVVLKKGFNEDEIIDFIKLTQFLPLSIRFIEFMPFAKNSWDKSKIISEKDILKIVMDHYNSSELEKLVDEKNFTSRNFKIKNYLGYFGIISSVTNPFCYNCNRIRLTANGKLKNCLFSNAEVDLLTPFRNGEPIIDLISSSINNKKRVRAGMTTIDELNNPNLNQDNRSMITIGG